MNSLSTVGGICLVTVGIVGFFTGGITLVSHTLPIFTVLIGIVIFAVSIAGLAGSYMNNTKVILAYFAILSVLVLTQIALLILAFSGKAGLGSKLDQAWTKAYKDSPKLIKNIELNLECCGYNSVTDRAYPKDSEISCYTSPYFGYTRSCAYALNRIYTNSFTLMCIAISVVLITQLITLCCAYAIQRKDAEENAENSRLLNQRDN